MAATWFRYHALALVNPRVKKLPDNLFRIWVNLMCIVCLEGDAKTGKLPAIEDVADMLNVTIDETKTAFHDLKNRGLIVTVGETFHIAKWKEKQYKSDTSTERVQRHRNAKRNGHETPPEQNRSDQKQNRSDAGNFSDENFEEGEGSEAPKPRPKKYNIEIFLKDEDRARFRRETNGDDIGFWAPKFNDFIVNKAKEYPTHPGGAFIAWVKKCKENEK